jgi:hypothetical protein
MSAETKKAAIIDRRYSAILWRFNHSKVVTTP